MDRGCNIAFVASYTLDLGEKQLCQAALDAVGDTLTRRFRDEGSTVNVRASFSIALDHQAARVRDIEHFAEIIHEQSYGGAART